MNGLIGFFTSKWVVQLLGLLVLALLVWFGGPLVAVAGRAPLEGEWARGLTIAALFAAWLAWRLLAPIFARRKDRQFGSELAGAAPGKSAEQQASEEEVDTLGKGFAEAMQILQDSRARGKGGKQCLYEKSWYVIIGPPGAGKTTALVNSGLKFPLAERFGKGMVKGVGGTRQCDWWFTDEAVLLDTAGRYTTQEHQQSVDAAGWQGFLRLVKKFRPRRPLNGVMVAMSLSDLLEQTQEERGRHAAAVRRRIQELHEVLGVRLPIYLLFTKTDLVAGFTDFFADLNDEGRAQVWGESFPAEDPGRPPDWLQRFDAGYDELLRRLGWRGFKRIQEEHDIQRRGLILDFPQQMALLKPALLAFLEGAFLPHSYEKTPPLLRGVYFTSGTQEGTPIDRAMGAIAHAFRLGRPIAPLYSGRGKSFFLARLLQDVIFPEAELAGSDPRIERRQKLVQLGAWGAALLATLVGIGLWTASYRLNQAAIDRTDEQIARYRAVDAAPADSRATVKMLSQKLDALLAVRDIWAQVGWLSHLGLFQGDKIDDGAREAYEQVQAGYFLPSLVGRLQERMQGPEGAEADTLYQLLRVYLMFGQPDKLDPPVAAAVIRADWERSFAAEPEVLARLIVHLQNLLEAKPRPTQLDEALVAAARARLTQVPQTQQCYDRFKTEALLDHSLDFKLAEALQPNGRKAFVTADGKDIGAVAVPGLYTARGYAEFFLKKSLPSVQACLKQNWVLGIPAASTDPREIERLHEGVEALYLGEYQQRWSALLAGVKPRPAQNIEQTVDLLDMLSRPDSPLRALLAAVEKNTSLGKVSAAAADLLAQAAAKANLAPDEQTRRLFDASRQAAGAGGGADPLRRLDDMFAGVNALVRGEAGKPVPLDDALAKAKDLRDYFMLQAGGAAQKGAGGGDVAAQARLEFARLPEPVRSWLMSLAAGGVSQTLSGAKGALNEKLKEAGIGGGAAGGGGGGGGSAGGAGGGGGGGGGASQCQLAFSGRYPFAKGSRLDAPLVDFAKFFAPNGVMDRFFQANLKDFVDASPPQWREKSVGGRSLGLSPVALRAFQLAAKIRDAFFAAGQTLQVQFDLKPVDLDPRADSFRLSIEGQDIAYVRGQEKEVRVQWPGPAPGSGVRIVFATPDKREASRGEEGPWAWFRLLDESSLRRVGGTDLYAVTFQAEGFAARYEIRPLSVNNPFGLAELQSFHCPESL